MMAEFARPPSPARWLLFLTVAVGGMRTELSFVAAGDAAPPGKI
ncbi:putative Prenylcysteine oxidase-like protein, partial [Naja naja]